MKAKDILEKPVLRLQMLRAEERALHPDHRLQLLHDASKLAYDPRNGFVHLAAPGGEVFARMEVGGSMDEYKRLGAGHHG